MSSGIGGLGYHYLASYGRQTNTTATGGSGQWTTKVELLGHGYQNFLIFIEGVDAFYDGNNVGFEMYMSNINSGTTPVSSAISYTYDARRGDGSTSHGYSNTGTTVPLQAWGSGGLSGGQYTTYEHYRIQSWIYVVGVTNRQPPRLHWTTVSNYGGRTDNPYGQMCHGMATLANGSGSASFDNQFTALLILATGGYDNRRYMANSMTSNSIKLWGLRG